jgi:hypothetical protein
MRLMELSGALVAGALCIALGLAWVAGSVVQVYQEWADCPSGAPCVPPAPLFEQPVFGFGMLFVLAGIPMLVAGWTERARRKLPV